MNSTFYADGYSDYQAGIYSPPSVPVLASEYSDGWNAAKTDAEQAN